MTTARHHSFLSFQALVILSAAKDLPYATEGHRREASRPTGPSSLRSSECQSCESLPHVVILSEAKDLLPRNRESHPRELSNNRSFVASLLRRQSYESLPHVVILSAAKDLPPRNRRKVREAAVLTRPWMSFGLPPCLRQIPPIRVARFNQRDLLPSQPALYLLFPGDRSGDIRSRFEKDELVHMVLGGKPGDLACSMLRQSAVEIIRYPDVENSGATCDDINEILLSHQSSNLDTLANRDDSSSLRSSEWQSYESLPQVVILSEAKDLPPGSAPTHSRATPARISEQQILRRFAPQNDSYSASDSAVSTPGQVSMKTTAALSGGGPRRG